MTLTITSKKTVAAACLVAPLALAACGSGDDASNVVSEMATVTNMVTEEQKPDEDKKAEEEKKSEEEKKPEDQNANPTGVVNPFENGTLPTAEVKPVDGGQPASQEDINAMTETMNRIYNPKDIVSWSRVIMDNSCKAVVDKTHQELAAQGTSLEQTENEMRQAVEAARLAGQPIPPVPSTQANLSDVRVNGDTASATVTVNTNGQTESGVQRFARENGQWKVCN
ncbi:hypothetical protein [Corynebacterium meitnerae]|uniref:Secreted protein n=1 Tax=Corynebacterium meitnerae TaxID=2913498 RepID=A0A9X3LT39_9CORY|nr:hypothetical protein [Corynebacterium meitnerae]MCZ9293281.1 hypothetical protein [Corynebacterium meitnerae]